MTEIAVGNPSIYEDNMNLNVLCQWKCMICDQPAAIAPIIGTSVNCMG